MAQLLALSVGPISTADGLTDRQSDEPPSRPQISNVPAAPIPVLPAIGMVMPPIAPKILMPTVPDAPPVNLAAYIARVKAPLGMFWEASEESPVITDVVTPDP